MHLSMHVSYVQNVYVIFLSLHTFVYLSYINQEGVLSLRAVSMQSAGLYTCHASNSEGNVTRVTKVKIKGQLLPGACLPACLADCLSVHPPACLSVRLPASSVSLCDACVPDCL